MKIQMRKVADLISDPNNARKHNEANLSATKGSLAKFGLQKPIVIDDKGVVIAGNGTLHCAKELGWEEIAVVVSDLKTNTDKTAYALADNRTAELAEWDDERLDLQIKALDEDGFDVEEIGFEIPEYNEPKEGNIDDDEVPEVEENIHGVKLGDLWQLGNHRLLCGDSTVKENVDRLMDGEKADMVFTDPPYGISVTNERVPQNSKNPHRENQTAITKKYKPIHMDDEFFDPTFIFNFFGYVQEIFLWGADNYLHKVPDYDKGIFSVWDKKGGHEVLDKVLVGDFELCWSKQRHKPSIARITWAGLYGSGEGKFGNSRVHPTQKPVKLAEWFFDRWGKEKNNVVDLFLGSGSTLLACEKTDRKCYGIEIDPHYCSVIIERWQQFTGEKAVRLEG